MSEWLDHSFLAAMALVVVSITEVFRRVSDRISFFVVAPSLWSTANVDHPKSEY
jgi:hypothetical protein